MHEFCWWQSNVNEYSNFCFAPWYCDGSKRHKYLILWLATGRSVQPMNSLIFPPVQEFSRLTTESQTRLSSSLQNHQHLQDISKCWNHHQTPPGDPNVRNRFSIEPPDISRIPKCLTTRFTTESPDTFQDIHMSETDSYRESPDISGIPKHHLTGSVLNLITPPRTSKCQKQIPVENHRTSLGFPSLIKQVHYWTSLHLTGYPAVGTAWSRV